MLAEPSARSAAGVQIRTIGRKLFIIIHSFIIIQILIIHVVIILRIYRNVIAIFKFESAGGA